MADSLLVHFAELFPQCVMSNANDRPRVLHAHTRTSPISVLANIHAPAYGHSRIRRYIYMISVHDNTYTQMHDTYTIDGK